MKPAVRDDNIFRFNLTPRERIAAAMFALGATRKDIARKLFISIHTAASHAKNIHEKTGVHNLADLTRNIIAEAMNIPIGKIEAAIRRYALEAGLARTILATIFLILNTYIIYIDTQDLARARANRKEARTTRAKAKRIKDAYYV